MPGNVSWTYTPDQMSNLSTLDYTYDDFSPPAGTPQPVARLQRLGVPTAAAEALVRSPVMAESKNVELLGANQQPLRLVGTEARTSVALDAAVRGKVSESLRAAASPAAAVRAAPAEPDRIFLNLENVQGLNDATAFSVYINVPDGADPANYPNNLAGNVALFGVSKASVANEEHAGDGLTFVLEITHLIDTLHLAGGLTADQLHVRLVPLKPVPEDAQIRIGRISIFRQGA
jgi:tyrosinase